MHHRSHFEPNNKTITPTYSLAFPCTIYSIVIDSDDQLCCLCGKEMNVELDPCGHSVLCSNCAREAKRCPICNVSWVTQIVQYSCELFIECFTFIADSNSKETSHYKVMMLIFHPCSVLSIMTLSTKTLEC